MLLFQHQKKVGYHLQVAMFDRCMHPDPYTIPGPEAGDVPSASKRFAQVLEAQETVMDSLGQMRSMSRPDRHKGRRHPGPAIGARPLTRFFFGWEEKKGW